MKPRRVEALAWVLIYSGLLLASLGLFVRESDATTGWTMMVVGALDAGTGAVLVWLRSRMKDERDKETP